MPAEKDFFRDVYDVVRLIPKGKVTSYGAIAKFLGAPRSSRMVGWAMNASHVLPDVPAHRVVNRQGLQVKCTSILRKKWKNFCAPKEFM